jgi:hypothetical protein
MPGRQTAPYGSWASPITSDLIVASTIGLSGILLDGAEVYWLESRPQENGRSVIVRRAADGTSADVTPPATRAGEATFSVRTRVHEYGGGTSSATASFISATTRTSASTVRSSEGSPLQSLLILLGRGDCVMPTA